MNDDKARTGPRVTLILGGARSGKTRHGLALAERSGLEPTMIATAQAFDDEMRVRIARHRAERGAQWTVVEEPLNLAEVVATSSTPDRFVVVDCLTLWLTNVMLAEGDVEAQSDRLLKVLRAASGPVALVSNEVGLGIVPENQLARRFRDAQGRLNQAVAGIADTVVFVAAGLPLVFKGDG